MLLIATTAIGGLWVRSYWPDDVEPANIVCSVDAPNWNVGSQLKIMSFNVQYMASKNYVFFYDIDQDDQDRVDAVRNLNKTIANRPSEVHVLWTLDKVVEVITKEDPDIILLQEVNGPDDSRTHHIDQAAELLSRLPDKLYPCHSGTAYWKAEFIFHPEVLGPVDMRLLTLSKYRLRKSVRHQLPRKPRNFLVAPFHFQRALLETHLATNDDQAVAVINTHYDAWGAGSGIMSQQVARTEVLLQALDSDGIPWVMGGDLNLLPPDNNRQRRDIQAAGTGTYDEKPQIEPLYRRYRGIPSLVDLNSNDPQTWFTHYPNDPTVNGPDRTIDYQFYSDQWMLEDAYVLQDGTLDISDHLPVIGVYTIPMDRH